MRVVSADWSEVAQLVTTRGGVKPLRDTCWRSCWDSKRKSGDGQTLDLSLDLFIIDSWRHVSRSIFLHGRHFVPGSAGFLGLPPTPQWPEGECALNSPPIDKYQYWLELTSSLDVRLALAVLLSISVFCWQLCRSAFIADELRRSAYKGSVYLYLHAPKRSSVCWWQCPSDVRLVGICGPGDCMPLSCRPA